MRLILVLANRQAFFGNAVHPFLRDIVACVGECMQMGEWQRGAFTQF